MIQHTKVTDDELIALYLKYNRIKWALVQSNYDDPEFWVLTGTENEVRLVLVQQNKGDLWHNGVRVQ